MDPKGNQLNNFNEVNVERTGDRTDIFRGSGGTDPNDSNNLQAHSHTVVDNGQIVFDRDEAGNIYTDTRQVDSPVDLPNAE